MLLRIVRVRNLARITSHRRTQSTVAVRNEEEYTATPQYPPILDLSFEKKMERKKAVVHEEVKRVPTVEEKQIKLNMPKYYGFKCYLFKENFAPYDDLELVQHITRTNLIVKDSLPEYYENVNVDESFDQIKSSIEEAIVMEYASLRRHNIDNKLTEAEIEDIVTTSVVRQINRIILNSLSNHSHLNDIQVDHDPRIESFWYSGGMDPPENIKRCRRGMKWMKPYENDPVDRAIDYTGSPSVALRSKLPLQPIFSPESPECAALNVPYFRFDPKVVGTRTDHKHIANIPGFWPGDPYQFGLLSYHKRGYLLPRDYGDENDNKNALHRQGILSSFAWLNAQANFLGFTTFNDITYPLVTQTAITNGKTWSFYVYQLNTMLLHSKHAKENPKQNVCWATPELALFKEIKDEKLIDFDDAVLKSLIKFYANVPKKTVENMTPYLGQSEKLIADYEDADKRKWLEKEYKFLVANRPRQKEMDEIYAWEKIYKIDNKTRPMDRRMRFFEVFQKPSNRRLDDRKPEYIPRCNRPDLPRNKGRDAKEYFPYY